jgi:hypothetical protein
MCYGSTTSRVVFVLLYLHRTQKVRCKQAAKPKQLECKVMFRPVSTFIFLFSVKIYDHSVKIFEILQQCHFPHISGISSSINELDTHPNSSYIWPSIPHIFGLSVLITINIRVSHTLFPIHWIGHLLHSACVIIMYRVAGLLGEVQNCL